MDGFRPFTLTHLLMLVAIAALTWILVDFARRQPQYTGSLERTLGFTNLLVWTLAHGWWLLPPRIDPATTLPLQLSHLTAVIASLALLTRWHWPRVLLYFWGFGLTTQALITPALSEPPSSIWFWAFWAQHGFVIAVAVYDVLIRGYRPRWRDFGLACRAVLLYALAMMPINLHFGANYGFVGNSRPSTPSIIDLIGPWPERLAIMALLVAGGFALLMLPWARFRRAEKWPHN